MLINLMDRFNSTPALCRAVWTARLSGEEEAPETRIIHSRWLQLKSPVRLERIGVRLGEGYFKCGSAHERDWIAAFRALVPREDGSWREILRVEAAARPADNEPLRYYALDNIVSRELIVEVRRSGVDGWWPSWNAAMTSLVVEADISQEEAEPQPQNKLALLHCNLADLPPGIRADAGSTEVRYRSGSLEVGFSLHKTGFTYFTLHEGQGGASGRSLLQAPVLGLVNPQTRTYLAQGIHLHAVGCVPSAGFQRNESNGTVRVDGNKVTYEVEFPGLGQSYRICWTVEETRLLLTAERQGGSATRAWSSSVWSMALDSRAIATTAIGSITGQGETGTLQLPTLFHAPGFGTLRVSALEGEGAWRFDSNRPAYTNVHEIKLGEVPQPEGDYLLLPGTHRMQLELKLYQADLTPVRANTPDVVVQAVNRFLITGITYRADTDTFSNNGNSMHSPLCMDYWSALTRTVDRLKPEWNTPELLRGTIERWLTDAPGYGSGRSCHHNRYYEDEYLMSGTASLLAVAEYLQTYADATWAVKFRKAIGDKLLQMKRRDLDGDGLIESDIRRGISGQHQWSTNWWDVISFGWKDALVNAVLYSALLRLEDALSRLRMADLAEGLADWAGRLKTSYFRSFFNDDTGWFAGWRCKENKLHDYAFLYVNGAAVMSGLLDDQPQLSRSIVEKLYAQLQRSGFREYRFGLPGNLWNIPDADLAGMMHNLPFGWYENGGATLSQTRHFVRAMYKVGLHAEADDMLVGFCTGLLDGTAFGGCGSGVDWRMWDGSPCGYEGLLCDQLGVLIPCVERYFVNSHPDGA